MGYKKIYKNFDMYVGNSCVHEEKDNLMGVFRLFSEYFW